NLASATFPRVAISKHPGPGVIAIDQLSFHAEDPNSCHGFFEQRPVPLFRAAQRRLGPFAIADITRDNHDVAVVKLDVVHAGFYRKGRPVLSPMDSLLYETS